MVNKDDPRIIRPGDIWDFYENNGHVVRYVQSVSWIGVVCYTCNGRLDKCFIDTFSRWAKESEAKLIFAIDWEGRES
jgi:hypothetical protein